MTDGAIRPLCRKLWTVGHGGGLHGCLLEEDHPDPCRCCCGTEVDWGDSLAQMVTSMAITVTPSGADKSPASADRDPDGGEH